MAATIMTEKLRLVTDFAELRAGDLVVISPCGWCGSKHRTLLLSMVACSACEPDGSRREEVNGFQVAHRRSCLPGFYKRDSVNESTVRHRVVYKVDTGLEREQSTETHKALEAVR